MASVESERLSAQQLRSSSYKLELKKTLIKGLKEFAQDQKTKGIFSIRETERVFDLNTILQISGFRSRPSKVVVPLAKRR